MLFTALRTGLLSPITILLLASSLDHEVFSRPISLRGHPICLDPILHHHRRSDSARATSVSSGSCCACSCSCASGYAEISAKNASLRSHGRQLMNSIARPVKDCTTGLSCLRYKYKCCHELKNNRQIGDSGGWHFVRSAAGQTRPTIITRRAVALITLARRFRVKDNHHGESFC
jgi:hypothetical protein